MLAGVLDTPLFTAFKNTSKILSSLKKEKHQKRLKASHPTFFNVNFAKHYSAEWVSKDIAFAQGWKIAICWKFQFISKRNTQKKSKFKIFFWLINLQLLRWHVLDIFFELNRYPSSSRFHFSLIYWNSLGSETIISGIAKKNTSNVITFGRT